MATPHRLTETTGSGGVQEVEYSEEPGKLYYFKYHVAGGTRYTRTLLEWMNVYTWFAHLFGQKSWDLFLLQRRGDDGTTAFYNKTSDFLI